MSDKAFFRTYAREIKKDVDFDFISEVVCDKLLNIDKIRQSSVIMLYMSLQDEINLFELYNSLKLLGKACCFPVVDGDGMYVSDARCGFKKGAFGIFEPCGTRVAPESIDLIVAPGVMFDTKCRRLGRGKGYYDKFLQGLTAYKIGVCPDGLLVDSLPYDEYDISMDMVITEKRMVFND